MPQKLETHSLNPMSEPDPAPAAVPALWHAGALRTRTDCDLAPATLRVADSWLVVDGTARGLELHRERFLGSTRDALGSDLADSLEAEAFWDAAIAALPRAGSWFPRVELRDQHGAPHLLLRVRPAPELRRSLVLATHTGRDPRTAPTVKGPDLASMVRLRTEAQSVGADEAVLVSPDGYLVEGATSSIVWWEGAELRIVDHALDRIPSTTERTILTLAAALGVRVEERLARPEDLDGCEVWAVNALHGIRIVTAWHGGPATAEEPGRLARWRLRLDALRRALPEHPDAASAAGANTDGPTA